MQRFFKAVDSYIKGMNVIDMGCLKICLASLGVIIGLMLPGKSKKGALAVAAPIFAFSYVYVMIRFVGAMARMLAPAKER